MIRINLLPWRETLRKERRQSFFVMLGLGAIIGIVVGVIGSLILIAQITSQESRNARIRADMVILDKQIEEIKGLQAQTDALLSRKKIIESLQANRSETVHIFNTLVRETPEGIYLTSLRQNGGKISLVGIAQTNARISSFMRNLEGSQIFENPTLIQSQAKQINNASLFEFNLEVSITRNTTGEDANAPKNAPKGGG